MRKFTWSVCILAAIFSLLPPAARAAAGSDKVVFAVVVTRHGVRSYTKTPPAYSWADWSPVAPGYLSARGYRLATYLGQFYRVMFNAEGLPLDCASRNAFVYADIDERTLATARALVEGACSSPDALPVFHDVRTGPNENDGFFDGADWLKRLGRIDAKASLAAVTAVAPNPPGAIVERYGADFGAVQRLVGGRCAGICPQVIEGPSDIVTSKSGLAELTGPLDVASGYAENILLEYAQCRPYKAMGASDPAAFVSELQAGLRLHVIGYDINARNAYNSHVRGGNIFAHLVAMLDEKAGVAHPYADTPNVGADNMAFLVGHDTQVGALGGILSAHWQLGNGEVPDDMPPGGALVFELYRTGAGDYRVRLRFVYQTFEQFRHYALVPNGVTTSPVTFAGCSGSDCSAPLSTFTALAAKLAEQGFVNKAWTENTDAPVALAPLANPTWTQCAL